MYEVVKRKPLDGWNRRLRLRRVVLATKELRQESGGELLQVIVVWGGRALVFNPW